MRPHRIALAMLLLTSACGSRWSSVRPWGLGQGLGKR
jgi:hypothetical protein